MAIKLFATDLDGTLLVNNRIPKENALALKDLQAAGIQVALVTGRVTTSAFWLAKEAGLNTAVIANNGAIGYNQDHQCIRRVALEEETLQKLIAIAKDLGLSYHFYDQNTYFSNRLSLEKLNHLMIDAGEGYRYQVGLSISDDPFKTMQRMQTQALKFQYLVFNAEEEARVLEALDQVEGIYRARSGYGLVEIQDAKVDKWTTLVAVAESMGIGPDQIAAIGDYENDLPMIQNARVGFAMGNAMSEVKAVADIVVASHTDFGVRHAALRVLSGDLL